MTSTEQLREILEEAAQIYDDRNTKRGDLWKQRGWRGALYDVRVCAERAWAHLWRAPAGGKDIATHDVDDLLDCINYCAMAIIAVREGNRDGVARWWPDD